MLTVALRANLFAWLCT